jgi:hypothetical protein
LLCSPCYPSACPNSPPSNEYWGVTANRSSMLKKTEVLVRTWYLIYYMAQDIPFENTAISSWNKEQIKVLLQPQWIFHSFDYVYLPSIVPTISYSIIAEHTDGERTLARAVAPAMLKGLSTDFSEGYCITDFRTHIDWRSKHSKHLLGRYNPTSFQMATHFFPVSVAQQPQKREAGQHTT